MFLVNMYDAAHSVIDQLPAIDNTATPDDKDKEYNNGGDVEMGKDGDRYTMAIDAQM